VPQYAHDGFPDKHFSKLMPIGMAAVFIAMLLLVPIQTTISARVLSTIAFNSSCSVRGTLNLSIVC
jgi:hypothetical protein